MRLESDVHFQLEGDREGRFGVSMDEQDPLSLLKSIDGSGGVEYLIDSKKCDGRLGEG